ncbi:MAG: N,N-dimethylformamidase beta subunit family domain-containing protein [Acidimicrobiales bacterium]
MPGPSTTRLVVIATLVVGAAIGGVVSLVPAARNANLLGGPAGPEVPETKLASNGRAPWIAEENAKPGTNDWRPSGPPNKNTIEGYADSTSATYGETVRIYISTSAPTYRVEGYRMGWYGGTQARLVWTSPTLNGVRQPPPTVDRLTRMVETRWAPSLDLVIDKSFPAGDYLFKLVADSGHMHYVPLTIRDDTSRAALLVINAVTTWQAYNRWGGNSLYDGVTASGPGPTGRSQVVSFDRPYDNDSGSGDFLGNELALVSMVEREGYDVTYATDIDLHHRATLLVNHKAILTLGHDEYWTLEMRTNVEAARERGVNLAFFGANAVFRQIRLTPSDLGPFRREINYRVAKDDPITGVDNSRVTVSWRDPPVNRPESALVGTYYQCNPVEADMVVADPTAWVFDGTGLAAGAKLPRLVGPEFDRYDPNAPQPPGPVQVLTHSPVRCKGQASFSDMTYYTTASGAGVLGTGTNWWVSRLNRVCQAAERCLDENVERITRNVLDAFAAGPAGVAHPSVANYSSLTGSTATTATTRVATTTTLPPTTVAPTTTPPTTRTTRPPTSLPTLPTTPYPISPRP